MIKASCVLFLTLIILQQTLTDDVYGSHNLEWKYSDFWHANGSDEMGVRWDFDCDFEGNDKGSTTTSIKGCFDMAYYVGSVNAFTWSSADGGTCWLKDIVDYAGNKPIKDPKISPGMVCGYLPWKMKPVG